MLTAALDGLVARYGLAGERLGEVVAGAVHQAQPRLQPDPRGRARLEPVADHAGLRHPAGLRHRPRGGDPRGRTRSRSARSSPASPAAPTPPPTRPSSCTEKLRRKLLRLNRAKSSTGQGHGRAGRSGPTDLGIQVPRQHRAAHRAVDGRAHGPHRAAVGHHPRGPGRAGRWPATTTSPPPTTAASSTTCSRPTSGSTRDQNLRPDSTLEKLGLAQAGLRQGRGRDDDGRQLHAAHRRRLGGAAGVARSGPPSTA